MNVRNTRARLGAVLFTSIFSSIAFAQVTPWDGQDSADFIDWGDQGVAAGDILLLPAIVQTDAGLNILVTKSLSGNSYIDQIPSTFLPNANFEGGDFVFDTYGENNLTNRLSFSYEDGRDFCGLGTQIAPFELGTFDANIEAFNDDVGSMGVELFNGTNTEGLAIFIGLMSDATTPMNRVEIYISDTELGYLGSSYVVNQVELKDCVTPEVPTFSCEGFAAPMAIHPVKAKKNRVFPLKMELFKDGIEQTDVELVDAPPVVQVLFSSTPSDDPIDVSGDVLSAGQGSEGNQFEYTDDGIWQFNLKSKNYKASGTYTVTVVPGDESYMIDPTCETSFEIK